MLQVTSVFRIFTGSFLSRLPRRKLLFPRQKELLPAQKSRQPIPLGFIIQAAEIFLVQHHRDQHQHRQGDHAHQELDLQMHQIVRHIPGQVHAVLAHHLFNPVCKIIGHGEGKAQRQQRRKHINRKIPPQNITDRIPGAKTQFREQLPP